MTTLHHPTPDCRHIDSYARSMMIERIMALHGRSQRFPKEYRRRLEAMPMVRLKAVYELIVEAL